MKYSLSSVVALFLAVSMLCAQAPPAPQPKPPKLYPAYTPSCLICGKQAPRQAVRAGLNLSTADVMEQPWSVTINGGVSTLTGQGTNDGFLTSTGIRLADHWDARADVFSLASNNTIVAVAGPEYFFSLAHLVKPNQYFNTANVVPFVNIKVGNAKGPVGSKVAYGIGGGFNIVLSPTMVVRPLDVTYLRSTVLANGHAVLGNHLQYAASVGLTF